MNNRTHGVLAVMIGGFCGTIACFVPGSTYVRALIMAAVTAMVIAMIC